MELLQLSTTELFNLEYITNKEKIFGFGCGLHFVVFLFYFIFLNSSCKKGGKQLINHILSKSQEEEIYETMGLRSML